MPAPIKLTREYVDRGGRTATILVEIDQGTLLDRALIGLAMRARKSVKKTASVFGGAIRVTVVREGVTDEA